MPARRFPRLAYNWISALGAAGAGVAALTILIFTGLQFTLEPRSNPYFGIFLYMVLPAFLVAGLLLIPLGMWRQWRRWQREGEEAVPRWPRIDLNLHSHRNATLVFVLGTLLFVVLTAVGSYEAYHYSESVAFCGTTCHSVMSPEFTTYQSSPHARVPCTACHVGPGANWYVKAKLSGAYQIYATVADKHPRPIPTPIENLRPAQETCEQCHWPQQIFGAQQRRFNHFKYDDANSPWRINLLIKTGGGDPASGQTAGIHWHMNVGVEVQYIARDERRQEIPWVRVRDRQTGRTTVYQDRDDPLSEEEIAAATPRLMDCMDCHNRPSHIFRSPDEAVDQALASRKLDPSLRAIKRLAVETISQEYATREEGLASIERTLAERYAAEYPEVEPAAVAAAVRATQEVFTNTIFPEMKARWSLYPDNIGHFNFTGCMRCHDGKHVDETGTAVTTQCTACHTILAQGPPDALEVSGSEEGLPFTHPEDIGDAWQEIGCHECHTGTQP